MNERTAPAVLPSNQPIYMAVKGEGSQPNGPLPDTSPDLVGERIAPAGLWQWVRNERECGHGAHMPCDFPVRCPNSKLSTNNRKITAEPQANSSLCHHNKSR
jgi:hypothetical protein